jgi:hypothetical protein
VAEGTTRRRVRLADFTGRVTHIDDGAALTTVAAADSNRKLSLLGRYLRIEYQEVTVFRYDRTLSCG